jgi:hypothetical protein
MLSSTFQILASSKIYKNIYINFKKHIWANYLHGLCAVIFAVAVAVAPIAAHAMGDEEFVGPFPTWTNVQTAFGAKGDGVTDDTAALQNAINSLSPTNPTLYLPAGTYLITHTLTLAAQQYVSIIGQNPSDTTILWGGASGGTMLDINGVDYSRFDRLTFNGQGNATVAVDQSWDGATGYFDTGNQYADDTFENAGTGLRCGNLGYGCAETSMLRDQFISDTTAGVAMKNFNALDMFVWYSLFQNDAEGITNQPGAGNFHVYDSIFENSTTADISIGNTGVFNFRNNYSIGSNQFIGPSEGTANPANITVQDNTILDTKNAASIAVGNLGPLVLIDNTIRSLASVTSGPVAWVSGFAPGDLFSIGNTFTAGSLSAPCNASSAPYAPVYGSGHCHEVDDQVVARSTINPTMPTLPGTPPNSSPQIFEVTPGMATAQIQAQIDAAAASGTDKPVVHIQPGTYDITATLVVPANSDMQIIGDGYYSQLVWAGTGNGPVIQLAGPSKATLRDFSVNGHGNSANGIEVDDADQSGSSVFMEQANLSSSDTNLFVDGLDYTNVQLHDFYHGSATTAGMASVEVTGGPSAAQGKWLGGATDIFAGASADSDLGYEVSNGAHLVIYGLWNDAGGEGAQVATITGASTFSYAGSTLFLPGTPTNTIAFNNFQGGTAALVNLEPWGPINITGNGSGAQVLALGLVDSLPSFFNNSASPAATTEFLNGQTTANPPSGAASSELPEQGTANPTFLTATLNQLRTAQPTLLAPLPSGVTDVRFYRIFVDSAIYGIHLDNSQSASSGGSGTSSGGSGTSSSGSGTSSGGSGTSSGGSGTSTTSLSPDGSTLSAGSGGTLTTAAGTWSFGTASNGSGNIILLNGQQAAGGWGALLLVYNGGQIYAENSQNNWYQWNSSGWTQIAGDPRGGISSDGSTLSAGSGGTLTTAAGTWSFGTASNGSGNIILLNGQQAAGGWGTLLLVYNGGQMYAENSQNNWYQWNSSGWTQIAGDPRGGISSDGSTLSAGSGGTLTTAAGTWSFGTASNGSGNIILLNGQQAAGGWGTLLLVYNGGQIYAENSQNNWYQWNSSGWTQIAGDPRG